MMKTVEHLMLCSASAATFSALGTMQGIRLLITTHAATILRVHRLFQLENLWKSSWTTGEKIVNMSPASSDQRICRGEVARMFLLCHR
jgi:hypothetical protein